MKKKPEGTQVDTIDRYSPTVQESFDLDRLDAFVVSLGVQLSHFRAVPSPIGKNERGDLRRNDGVDTITSNGMIYRFAGKFTATITNNSRNQKRGVSGVTDPSEAHLVMPRFYDKDDGSANGERIYLMPGDRLYIADPETDVKVGNYQEMTYEPGVENIPMFPIVTLQDKIVDSRNTEFTEGVDFVVNRFGNIEWCAGGNNPGIDVQTGKGRNYSIRYLYNAYYYVVSLPHEVRITNVTTGGERSPQRMPYEAVIVREYIFHNQNRGSKTNQNVTPTPQRVEAAPIEPINPGKYVIPVDMSNIESEDDE